MRTTLERMELFDAMQPWERELVGEFGLARALEACRRWATPAKARTALETEREALQVQRWKSITLGRSVARGLRRG